MILTLPTTAERVRPLTSRRVVWLAGLYYLVGAIAVTMWLWRDPASRIVASNPYDTDQFTWFFRYDATAVAHLRLPALITTGMNAPQGISLMWNTAMPLPGVLLAPLTLLAGPQASLTVLMTLGFAGSAVSMFATARRWDASTAAAGLTLAAPHIARAAAITMRFAHFAEDDQRRTIAFNSDSPHLPRSVLEGAFETLAVHDVVVGPTHDGGYYLVGATASHPTLFAGDGMGTSSALENSPSSTYSCDTMTVIPMVMNA